MNLGTLILNGAEVKLVYLRQKAGTVQIELRASQPSSLCPGCSRRSTRSHSRYRRSIADLPWEGRTVEILLEARKFFCENKRCPWRIFTEPLAAASY